MASCPDWVDWALIFSVVVVPVPSSPPAGGLGGGFLWCLSLCFFALCSGRLFLATSSPLDDFAAAGGADLDALVVLAQERPRVLATGLVDQPLPFGAHGVLRLRLGRGGAALVLGDPLLERGGGLLRLRRGAGAVRGRGRAALVAQVQEPADDHGGTNAPQPQS